MSLSPAARLIAVLILRPPFVVRIMGRAVEV